MESTENFQEGYSYIPYHMIFDTKFDGRRKTRLMARGYMVSDGPKEEVYSGVISMETIKITFMMTIMNNLEVCAADVSTALLYSKTREKVYVITDPEFGITSRKRMLIDKGLYELASSTA